MRPRTLHLLSYQRSRGASGKGYDTPPRNRGLSFMAKKLIVRPITTTRQLVLLHLLKDGAKAVPDLVAEYAMFTQEMAKADVIRPVVRRMMKAGSVRYASSQTDIHPMELNSKMYVLTPEGRETLEGFLRLLGVT